MNDVVSYYVLGPENADLLDGADVFDNAVNAVQLAAFVASAGHELVFAIVNGKVIGMASGVTMLHPDKQPLFFVNEVGVNEDMQRRGIATKLSQMLMDNARAQGCRGIWLATEIENSEARALYRKLGGRETEGIVVCDWDGAMDS